MAVYYSVKREYGFELSFDTSKRKSALHTDTGVRVLRKTGGGRLLRRHAQVPKRDCTFYNLNAKFLSELLRSFVAA